MPDLSDEAILEISDEPEASESTTESVESTTESAGQYGDESQQQAETATETESHGKEQQVAREEREPARYEDLGSAEELRELVDADQLIFSADRADNQQWIEKFSTDHKETFNRLLDLSLAHVQKTIPAKWEQIGKNAVKGLFERDRLWDFLEAEFAANKGNPATQEFLQKFASYIASFGVGPAQQNTHPGFDQETRAAINADLETFFEKHIDESLPQLRDLPAQSRALVLRKVHAELQSAMRADENYMAALKRALHSGAPDALDRAIDMIARRGLTVLPAIAKRWGKAVPVPLRQAEANAMSEREVLNSDRPADSRAGRTRTQNRPTRLTREQINRLDPRELLNYGPIEVSR